MSSFEIMKDIELSNVEVGSYLLAVNESTNEVQEVEVTRVLKASIEVRFQDGSSTKFWKCEGGIWMKVLMLAKPIQKEVEKVIEKPTKKPRAKKEKSEVKAKRGRKPKVKA